MRNREKNEAPECELGSHEKLKDPRSTVRVLLGAGVGFARERSAAKRTKVVVAPQLPLSPKAQSFSLPPLLRKSADQKHHSQPMTAATLTAQRTEALQAALQKMERTTRGATRCADQLADRARQLDSLTSPASDASSMLSRANANLAATLVLLKDAREKFDTVTDCEPALERLYKGVATLEEGRNRQKGTATAGLMSQRVLLTEQDVYAAADSMEILRDAHRYFSQHTSWRSTPNTLSGIERLYKMGEDSMSLLVNLHLKGSGPAVRPTRKQSHTIPPHRETSEQTRARLSLAVQNRDLLKSIGEVEEFQPLEARPIREIRSIFGCLGGHGYTVALNRKEPPGLNALFGYQPQQMIRTEKVGSGCYNKVTKSVLETGFAQLDAYGQSRREIAYASMDSYHRRLKNDRKKRLEKSGGRGDLDAEAMAAARDAVRCLEHAMIVIAGEKNVYRTVVTPALAKTEEEAAEEEEEGEVQIMSPYYRKACVGTYSYVVGAIVDRALDVIETVFLKEGGIGQTSGKDGASTNALAVPAASAAAAAGLRMLDGVRMLGPSLAKLCEMQVNDGYTDSNSSIASVLCIAIHRATVKNTARTLENLAKAIQEDPNKGPRHRPKDASVSVVSIDSVKAIRSLSPFMSAYRSVSKRRALPWDPNMGEDAGEMDSFVRYLVMRLLNSLKGKALDYTRDGRDDSQAKANIFMINNAYYLLEELGPSSMPDTLDEETYRISGSWFDDKVKKLMESEKNKYFAHWEALNAHLTAVDTDDLDYKKDGVTLSYESGKLIKQRFSGFNEAFKLTWDLHKNLCIIDAPLRLQIQQGVSSVFLPRYRRFYEKYKRVKFSKKNQSDYLKYTPEKVEDLLSDMYVDPEK